MSEMMEITAQGGKKVMVDTSNEVCEQYGGKGFISGARIVTPQGKHGTIVGVGEEPATGLPNLWFRVDEEEYCWVWRISLFIMTLREEGFRLESEVEAEVD